MVISTELQEDSIQATSSTKPKQQWSASQVQNVWHNFQDHKLIIQPAFHTKMFWLKLFISATMTAYLFKEYNMCLLSRGHRGWCEAGIAKE